MWLACALCVHPLNQYCRWRSATARVVVQPARRTNPSPETRSYCYTYRSCRYTGVLTYRLGNEPMQRVEGEFTFFVAANVAWIDEGGSCRNVLCAQLCWGLVLVGGAGARVCLPSRARARALCCVFVSMWCVRLAGRVFGPLGWGVGEAAGCKGDEEACPDCVLSLLGTTTAMMPLT